MIVLDTNVLVRFLTQDDPGQGRRASALMDSLTEDAPGYVCREVTIELVWVLERAYRSSREEVSQAVEGLLDSAQIVVEAADRVGMAVHLYRTDGVGFSDAMIALGTEAAGAGALMTFDKRATRMKNVQLVPD